MLNQAQRGTLIAALGISMLSCGQNQQNGMSNQAPEYAVMTVDTSKVDLNTSYSAKLRGKQDIEIRPNVSGFITKVCVDEGATVKKGETLFIIDPVQYEEAVKVAEAAVNVAKANVATAELTAENKRELARKNIISQYDLQTAENSLASQKANLAQAEAQLINARKDLSYTRVTSPSNGVVGKIPFRVGSLVGPTTAVALTTVADVSEIIVGLHIRATQDESFFGPVLLNLLNKMDRQIMILHAITPIDRVRNIHVAIPKNAEYEAGFYRWLERIARMGQNTNSRIFWHGHPQTLSLIQSYLQHYHTGVVREMCETDGGNELKRLSTIMQPDDLMVIIMARHGSVSFRPSLEHVPHQINAYYTEKNFILLFPDSYARTSSELTFVELHGTRGTYEKKKRWFDFLWEKKG